MDLEQFIGVYDSVPIAYYEWMFEKIEERLSSPVLEIGSGPGIITRLLLDKGLTVTGIDNDRAVLGRLEKIFADRPGLALRKADAGSDDLAALQAAPFATALCLNLLEHMDDDVNCLVNIGRALAPAGRLIVLVPAHPGLYGRMDEMFGHFRRYTRSRLESVLDQAGFTGRTEYFNLLGILGWWWRFKILGRDSFSPAHNRIYQWALPLIRAFESRVRVPTGLSLIACGVKRD